MGLSGCIMRPVAKVANLICIIILHSNLGGYVYYLWYFIRSARELAYHNNCGPLPHHPKIKLDTNAIKYAFTSYHCFSAVL
jgi:hypothetical protein